MQNLELKLRQTISGSRILSATFHAALRKYNATRFKGAMEASREMPFYNETDRPINFPIYPTDSAMDNALYGIGETLKEYAGLKSQTRTYVEHGVFFGNHIQFDEKDHWAPKIVTFSGVRAGHLADHGVKKMVLPIGPYIHYAHNHLPDAEFRKIKANLGRVLLVITGHSTTNYLAQFENYKLIEKINLMKADYDTVLVLFYFIDLAYRDRYQPYIDAGYKIVSAGHKFDPGFLNRLRTIISLADNTVSNAVGTHIGYCVALGKPHFLCDESLSDELVQPDYDDIYKSFREKRAVEVEEVAKEFRIQSNSLLPAQRAVVSKYWGQNYIRSRQELRDLLLTG